MAASTLSVPLPCHVLVRLFVPAAIQPEYLAAMERVRAAVGAELTRFDLLRDPRRLGFFVECYVFRGVVAYAAARDGDDEVLAALFAARRRIIPESHEETTVWVPAPLPSSAGC